MIFVGIPACRPTRGFLEALGGISAHVASSGFAFWLLVREKIVSRVVLTYIAAKQPRRSLVGWSVSYHCSLICSLEASVSVINN